MTTHSVDVYAFVRVSQALVNAYRGEMDYRFAALHGLVNGPAVSYILIDEFDTSARDEFSYPVAVAAEHVIEDTDVISTL